MSTLLGGEDAAAAEPVSEADLLAYFKAGEKPRSDWRIGAEFEKFLLERATGRQIGFSQRGGAADILPKLADRFQWTRHFEDKHLTALSRDGATVSVEPGGQIEYSSPPLATLRELEADLLRHRDELHAVIDTDRIAVVACGVTPFSAADDIPFGPRPRHVVMSDYLPTRCRTAHQMMKTTASTQVTFDYANEADAGRKVSVALTLSPVVNAIWGNSGIVGGAATGWASERGRVWLGMDADRSGLLPQLLTQGFDYRTWTNYLLDVPMLFHRCDGDYHPAGGRTFRDFLNTGIDGRFPTRADWELHITTVFPEVRLKHFLEVRGADANPPALALAVPAVWKGLLYDADALTATEALTARFPPDELPALFESAAKDGLSAEYRGHSLLAWAGEVADIAAAGLKRQGESDSFLDPVFAVLDAGVSPGGRWRGKPTVAEVLTAGEY